MEGDSDTMIAKVLRSDSTRRETFLQFNLDQAAHQIYADITVPGSHRKVFSLIRLSSHFLEKKKYFVRGR